MFSFYRMSIGKCVVCVLCICCVVLSPGYAQEGQNDDYEFMNLRLNEGEELPRSDISKRYSAQIEKILSSDEFAQKKTVTQWRFINSTEAAQQSGKIPEWIIRLLEFIDNNEKRILPFSRVLEVFLWAAVIALIIWLISRYRVTINRFFRGLSQEPNAELPTTLFGLDVKQDSLPKDVVASAKLLWKQEKKRPAIGLLLRSSLIKLLHEHEVRLFDSDTEAECCERIDGSVDAPVSSFMRSLVQQWQQIAYAHVAPSENDFDKLCQAWQRVF